MVGAEDRRTTCRGNHACNRLHFRRLCITKPSQSATFTTVHPSPAIAMSSALPQ